MTTQYACFNDNKALQVKHRLGTDMPGLLPDVEKKQKPFASVNSGVGVSQYNKRDRQEGRGGRGRDGLVMSSPILPLPDISRKYQDLDDAYISSDLVLKSIGRLCSEEEDVAVMVQL